MFLCASVYECECFYVCECVCINVCMFASVVSIVMCATVSVYEYQCV